VDAGPEADWDSLDWDGWADPAPAAPAGTAEDEAAPASGPGPGQDPDPDPGQGRDSPGDPYRTDAGPGQGAGPPEPAESAAPPWLWRETGDGGAELVRTLAGDLFDGVRGVLMPMWGTVERDPAAAGRLPVAGPVAGVLDEQRERLAEDPAVAPSFARDRKARPGSADLLGVGTARTAELLAGRGDDSQLTLCAFQHRWMLSKDPAAARRLRFAPEAVRRDQGRELSEHEWHALADDIVWTSTGRFAGALRLVPLRAGIVRAVRSTARHHDRAGHDTAGHDTAGHHTAEGDA
jgi:hypothetical protein